VKDKKGKKEPKREEKGKGKKKKVKTGKRRKGVRKAIFCRCNFAMSSESKCSYR
jgi:hypothetical protein